MSANLPVGQLVTQSQINFIAIDLKFIENSQNINISQKRKSTNNYHLRYSFNGVEVILDNGYLNFTRSNTTSQLYTMIIISQRISRMYEQANYQTFNYNNSYNNQFASSPTKTVDLYGSARAAFIQKVYTVLSAQILITVMFVILSVNSTAFFLFQLQNTFLFYLCLFICIGVEIYMFCCHGGRASPQNYICLGLFTLAEAYIVSFVSSITGKESGNSVVLLAGIYTLAIVIALTIYACKTTSDFTTSMGLVLVLFVCLVILGIATIFVQSAFLTNLYCCVGVLLFGLYLVIDTQMIVGGKSVELTVDEYALAALLLYIDIIQIFMYILKMLSNKE